MPPKGRPRRAATRKKAPPTENPTIPTDEIHAEIQQPLPEAPLPDNDVVLAPSSETLISGNPEVPAPQEQASDSAVMPQDDVVLCSEEPKDKSSTGKVKKVVKKTVKVVKKVIKRVPKKAVNSEIDSKVDQIDKAGDNLDSVSKPEIAGVREEESKSASTSILLKGEIHDSNTYSNFQEEEPKSVTTSAQLKAENHDLISNATTSAGVEKEDSIIGGQLKPENLDSGVLVCKMEEKVEGSDVEVDEKKEVLEGVHGENVVAIGSELMEIEKVTNNEGDVEESGGECGKEIEGLVVGEGGEGVEVEDGKGEGKLFRGELGAMERKKRRKTEIFIGRLDKDVQEEDIRKVFAEVGEIVDLRLILNSKTGKKFAFLRYASAEEAKTALHKFAKVEICGKECGATPVEGNDTIFLGNIDRKWKYEDVANSLNKIGIGKIDKVTVMMDNRECNRGFAFVEFLTIHDAQLAYMKLQEKDVFGKNHKVKVAWAEPLKDLDEEEMLKVKTVYAEFIPSSWDEMKLRDTFNKFGEIDDIVLARNLKTTKRKDFAFISFKTREAAIQCIESFSHDLSDKDGSKVNMKVSLAKPKPKGKKRLIAKSFSKEPPQAMPRASHSKVWSSEPSNRTQLTVPRHSFQVPDMSSTNFELVRLLREQASWRSPHANIGNSAMNICYSNPLSGRKRQYSELDTDLLHGNSNRYPRFHLDAPYSVASSSQNIMPPNGLTNPMTYQQRAVYTSGSLYGARNYANNVEIRDKAHESSFPYRRY